MAIYKTYSTVSEMKDDTTLQVNMMVMTAGYHNAGDGVVQHIRLLEFPQFYTHVFKTALMFIHDFQKMAKI